MSGSSMVLSRPSAYSKYVPGSMGKLDESGRSLSAGSMNSGSTVTSIVDWSLGVGGLEELGAVPEDGGSEDGVPISVKGVSVRCGGS